MYPYDPALLAAAQAAPQSIADVIATMQSMDDLLPDGDGLKWFNWLYLQVTKAVQARTDGGGLANATWLEALDVQFAKLYFGALTSWLGPGDAAGSTPGCWRALFVQRGSTPIARIQFALAGINAHINHDLPEAIVNTYGSSGGAPVHGGSEYVEYTSLNAQLDSIVETAKTQLHVRLLGGALPPVSHLEDTLAAWSVAASREAAWTNAEVLWRLQEMPDLSGRYEEMLDGITAVAGKALLVPAP
jgi:hypothetical protein